VDVRRVISLVSAAVVAAIAAIASYGHILHVATDAGQSGLVAHLLPLSVDGLVIVGSMGLADRNAPKGWAWAAFLIGVAASLAANVIAAEPELLARVVSAWPAVALLITGEVLVKATGKAVPAPTTERLQVRTVADSDKAKPSEVRLTAKGGVGDRAKPGPKRQRRNAKETTAKVAKLLQAEPAITDELIAAQLGMARRTARRYASLARGLS